ncbi:MULTISPECIES: MarR family winged helix-turn-helix transcriptional regulator [Thalassospira]|uniref:Transcriptional regulator n=2 Tax=Thalassospira TaxID=168934 RepID=A0A367VX46_9PROT|nr:MULTISPECIES: MarR family transcriptional regulator [Thalassospira]MDG4721517.1 MarR family transcriptional regulator [Thalassospira sp. FZY0004]RCK30360.1 transcriptional regulator [Thalassospira profundimaris]
MENIDLETPYLTLGSALMRVARCWQREVNRTLAAHGLSQTMVMPLIVLHRGGGAVRQGVIAEEIGVEGPSLVRVIDQLERDDLISRVCDPTDRRAKMVALTDAGKQKAAEIEVLLAELRGELTANIPAENLNITLDVMRALLDQLALRDKGA